MNQAAAPATRSKSTTRTPTFWPFFLSGPASARGAGRGKGAVTGGATTGAMADAPVTRETRGDEGAGGDDDGSGETP